MADVEPSPGPKPIWAYAYQLVPPQPEDLMRTLQTLLDCETAAAGLAGRNWQGRLVLEERVTQILVVSDMPAQDLQLNRGLEAELRDLGVTYFLTVPMAVEPMPVPPFLAISD